ncbi:10145_t:CDS:2, partial [Scutellospora calospora]
YRLLGYPEQQQDTADLERQKSVTQQPSIEKTEKSPSPSMESSQSHTSSNYYTDLISSSQEPSPDVLMNSFPNNPLDSILDIPEFSYS